MSIQFTDNASARILPAVISGISTSRESRVAVAFLNRAGLSLLEASLQEAIGRGSQVEFLIGLDPRITEANALRRLRQLGVLFLCYRNDFLSDTPFFHPKLYIFTRNEDASVIVGSSNLTAGGLKDNIEVNIELTLPLGDERLSDIYEIYQRLKFLKGSFLPDDAYLDRHSEYAAQVRARERRGRRSQSTRAIEQELRERARVLPKPTIQARELFGWQKLVYDKLPARRFHYRELYQFEGEFQHYYPQNLHVRDKIRQILQQLERLKLLKRMGRGFWELAA